MTRTRTSSSFLSLFLSAPWIANAAHAELTLSAPRVIANPGGPVKIVAVDISHYGMPDLVVANSTANSISVHPGIGSGKYA